MTAIPGAAGPGAAGPGAAGSGAAGPALVWCPFPDAGTAHAAAKTLLDERLVACANILPAIQSLFDWQGERGEGMEAGMLLKTDAALLAGAAAILPATMLSAMPVPVPSAQFSPPDTRLLLTRTLRSPLADGREIVSRRSYDVVIVPDGEGYRVDGQLVEVAVEAPAQLAPIAEIERRRPDTGLFPLWLDARGLLVPARRQFDRSALREAAGVATQVLDRDLPGGAPPGVVDGFVAALEAGAGESRWPEDLFRPTAGRRVERRKVALPDGGSGEVEVEIVASTGDENLARMQRTVTTALGPSKRVTREEWVLALAR